MELKIKTKAIFLDRDGVVNKERGDYTYKVSDFELTEGLINALQILICKNYLLIVITNQAGIAKGIYSIKEVEITHHHLLSMCLKNGISITEIYFCPHYPEKSNCICRKPDSLMIEKAMARYNIAPELSFFIGDNERDIIAAKKVGVNPILIKSNDPLHNYLHLIP